MATMRPILVTDNWLLPLQKFQRQTLSIGMDERQRELQPGIASLPKLSAGNQSTWEPGPCQGTAEGPVFSSQLEKSTVLHRQADMRLFLSSRGNL